MIDIFFYHMPTEKLCVRANTLLWQIDVPKHGSNDIKRLALNDKAGGVTMPINIIKWRHAKSRSNLANHNL